MGSLLDCKKSSVPDMCDTIFEPETCQLEQTRSPRTVKRFHETSKMVQHEVACLRKEMQAVIDSRLTSLTRVLVYLEEEFGGSVHGGAQVKPTSTTQNDIADVKASLHAVPRNGAGNARCSNLSSIADMKAAFHAVLRQDATKSTVGISDVNPEFQSELGSSDGRRTLESKHLSPQPPGIIAGCLAQADVPSNERNADVTTERVSSSTRPPYKRPSRFQVLRKDNTKDEVILKQDAKPAMVPAEPSMLGESVLSSSLFRSQESVRPPTDAPSERQEATAFISWTADSQDVPMINWGEALGSAMATGANNKKETSLHRALQALLDSQKTGTHECNTVGNRPSDEHVVMHQSHTASHGTRLSSTTFISWSAVVDVESEGTSLMAAPVPLNKMEPTTPDRS